MKIFGNGCDKELDLRDPSQIDTGMEGINKQNEENKKR